METPSSVRRITSESKALTSRTIPMWRKIEESDNSVMASRERNVKMDRWALVDITNDSPIAGLAMGSLGTPSSLIKKREQLPKQTPGTGEAFLRGQVKILLQKVEEETKGHVLGISYSSGILAPTNTPQFPNQSGIHQDVGELKKQEAFESEKSEVTRALMFEKAEEGSNLSSTCSAEKKDDVSTQEVNTSMGDGEVTKNFVQNKPLPDFLYNSEGRMERDDVVGIASIH